MFKKEKLENARKETLPKVLKELELQRDLIIDLGRKSLAVLPTDFFYFVVESLIDVFPEMKKNKELAGYFDRRKKFTELYVSVYPESKGDITEDEYTVRFNKFKTALSVITKEINEIKKELGI